MFFLGSIILIGGFYYRKKIAYNSVYAYIILENNINVINNKYFRNKITIHKYNPYSIIEIYNNDFTKKKYKLVNNNSETNIADLSLDFNSKNLFLSIELIINDNKKELSKEINLFTEKDIKLLFNYDLANIFNQFFNLKLEITKENYNWKILDNNFNNFEGKELLFKIDENYFLTFIN